MAGFKTFCDEVIKDADDPRAMQLSTLHGLHEYATHIAHHAGAAIKVCGSRAISPSMQLTPILWLCSPTRESSCPVAWAFRGAPTS